MKALLSLIFFSFLETGLFAADRPIVFWASDSVKPGDFVLLYGEGLTSVPSVRIQRLPDEESEKKEIPDSKTNHITHDLDIPIFKDGKTVGSIKVVAGTAVDVVSNDGTSATIKRGDALYSIPANALPVCTTSPSKSEPLSIEAKSIQTCNASLKFQLPDSMRLGIYAVDFKGNKPVVINRPQLWFLQPEHLEPGLVENQAPPGAKIQIIGKDILLSENEGKPLLLIYSNSGEVSKTIKPDHSEKFSLRATLPTDLAPGIYQIRVSNGFGGKAGYSDPLTVQIRRPETWSDRIFNVRSFGAHGDDTNDDTAAIRAALDAAEKNGGGVVYFPWGTYRINNWIRIPRKTILRGEDRDASLLKWPVDEPQSESDFIHACVYGDTSYGIENLSLIARKSDEILHDLSSHSKIIKELKPFVSSDGSHDVFLRHVAFHHWKLCSHPDRNQLWTNLYTDDHNSFNFRDGSIRNFEVSDCLFQGANQVFYNIQNARIIKNSFSNGMGHCWTCLGGGAWFTVAEDNEMSGASSWGAGKIGMKFILSSKNISRCFAHGEREAMTLDISLTPATPYYQTPEGIHFLEEKGGQNIAWFGLPQKVSEKSLIIEGIKAAPGEFVGKTVMILDGPGAGQYREITDNSSNCFTLDRPWDVPPTTASTVGLWDLCRHMIVSECKGYDTSAFAQLYGSFYDYIVDGCIVDRSQGTWGQSGWFVQFRYNHLNYGFSYHHGGGMSGSNPEGVAPYGFNGLIDGNLRISKFGSSQYGVPGGKPLFVKDVTPHPVPGVRGCIIRGNSLDYNQRAVLMPGHDPMERMGTNEFIHMTDCLIDRNVIRHSDVGIFVGGLTSNTLVSGNSFLDVKTNVVANPVTTLEIGSTGLNH